MHWHALARDQYESPGFSSSILITADNLLCWATIVAGLIGNRTCMYRALTQVGDGNPPLPWYRSSFFPCVFFCFVFLSYSPFFPSFQHILFTWKNSRKEFLLSFPNVHVSKFFPCLKWVHDQQLVFGSGGGTVGSGESKGRSSHSGFTTLVECLSQLEAGIVMQLLLVHVSS